MTHDRRLIEDSLPLEAISAQSAREKSIRHGHISTLHIWWARRPLAAMRAAIFASLIPAPKDEKERAKLHELIGGTYDSNSKSWKGGIVDWDSVKDGNNAAIEEARELIRKHYPDAPPKVLDPFMGGGSTGLEALRLGAEAHGVELNPVAYLIELCTLVYPQKYGQPMPRAEYLASRGIDPAATEQVSKQKRLMDADATVNPLAEDVRRWGMWVLEEARKEIGHLYEDPEGRTIVAYLWARTAECPNPQCGAEMPLVRQYWLVKRDKRKVSLKPIIDTVNKSVRFEVVEGDEINFDPENATMREGTVTCLVCGSSADGDYLRQQAKTGEMKQKLMGVVTLSREGSGKDYRSSTESDLERYADAQVFVADYLQKYPDFYMDERISDLRPSPNARGLSGLPRYGLEEFAQLFNSRQMLVLGVFSRFIDALFQQLKLTHESEYAKAVCTYLAFALDKVADYNSALCTWHNSREVIGHTFARQAIPMVWDYSEANPFSSASGDWLGAIDWVNRVIEHCTKANVLPALLTQANSVRLPKHDCTMDAVITDPPYYDSVPYSDLSDYFYVILKRSIGNLYPEILSLPLTPKSTEIIEHARHGERAKNFYEEQMTLAFAETNRVTSDNGVIAVVFAHTSTAAWETLINSLLNSSLVVTASWPLHTEMANRMVAMGNAALASSIFIVCRKRMAEAEGFYDDVRREMQARIKERLDFFWSEGIRGADFFISAIGPAVEVFGRYTAVRKLSGEVVSVAALLDLVQEAVADYTLGRVLNGRYKMGTVDAPTRFYVMYRWSYGDEKLPFDDARRLAQALGAEVSDLIRGGVLKQSGDSVTMPGANDKLRREHLGEAGRDGSVPPVIDVLHRAVQIWQESDRRALAEYLAQHALGREDEVKAVAQALVNVLPQGDRERQLLENYLTGSGNLPDVPRQKTLL